MGAANWVPIPQSNFETNNVRVKGCGQLASMQRVDQSPAQLGSIRCVEKFRWNLAVLFGAVHYVAPHRGFMLMG